MNEEKEEAEKRGGDVSRRHNKKCMSVVFNSGGLKGRELSV